MYQSNAILPLLYHYHCTASLSVHGHWQSVTDTVYCIMLCVVGDNISSAKLSTIYASCETARILLFT